MNASSENVLEPKPALVAEHASIDFGGEAALPCHYFRELHLQGIPAHLVVHERSQEFLTRSFPALQEWIHYVPDTLAQQLLSRCGKRLPERLSYITLGFLIRLLTQRSQRRILKTLIDQGSINLVHQIIPVSPREPSSIYGLEAPVIIGPMNGGMEFPVAFARHDGFLVQTGYQLARQFTNIANWFIPGKRRATLLLVANQRTQKVLPRNFSSGIIEIVENAVDLNVWQSRFAGNHRNSGSGTTSDDIDFVFVGRLVELKAVDILIEAFVRAFRQSNGYGLSLSIIGDGPERAALTKLARKLLDESQLPSTAIQFLGWLSQEKIAERLSKARALVMPSIKDCGGSVVLEAMASRLPVIATQWGGPADYLTDDCGILIPPTSRDFLIEGHAKGILELTRNPDRARTMGDKGLEKVKELYTWNAKAGLILKIYSQALTLYSESSR